MNSFLDLTDEQQKNVLFFLDKAQNHELYKLKTEFEVKFGKNLPDTRNNVLHSLMMGEIDFDYFIKWLNHVDLEGNNSLFVYETDNSNLFKKIKADKLIDTWSKKTVNIFDINIENLKAITLTDVCQFEEQVLFTFAAPSYIVKQKIKGDVPDVNKDIYLAYITVDFENEQFVLSMHPTNNLYSVGGTKKKKDMDSLAPQFINYFRKNIIAFNFSDPDWIIDAIFDITEEYFEHNNPIITKKLKEFEQKRLSDITELFTKDEKSFEGGPVALRIQKAIKELYESQLIAKYGTISKETPFKVFLNETGKGVTSFRADSRGKALSFADSYEIVKKMIENADIASLGITYINNGREYPYKIVKEATYYSLKRITTALTEKEIVDHVLRQLKQYKPGEEISDSSGKAKDNK